jgi:hypothetical protein
MNHDAEKKIDQLKTENLAAGGKFRMDEIPLRKFYDQAQYIEKTLLPAIERKSGKTSVDYQFFSDVYRSLLYAVMIVDRDRSLVMKLQHARQMNAFLQARADLAESELLKYTTLEDIWLTDAQEKISVGVRQRVENLLTNKTTG